MKMERTAFQDKMWAILSTTMMMMALFSSSFLLLPLQASAFPLTQRPGLEQQPAHFLTQIQDGRDRDVIMGFAVLLSASSGSEAAGSEVLAGTRTTIPSSDLPRRMFLISAIMSPMIPRPALATEESAEADPFAQLDSFASSIGAPPSSSGATTSAPPNSSSGATSQSSSPHSSNSNNDLSNALQRAKKKRQIDPRTHG